MRSQTFVYAVAIAIGLGILAGCSGGGGGGKKSPFPGEVRSLFGAIEDAFEAGVPVLPASITCGVVSNPLDADNSTSVDDIFDKDDHSGTVLQATTRRMELRGAEGRTTLDVIIEDTADLDRIFLDVHATSGKMKIAWMPPPIGAKDFLASDGTGQSFALVSVERSFDWTNTFTNDPVGTVGSGTLVDFSGDGKGGGGPAIPAVSDGTRRGTWDERRVFLVEFTIQPGPSGNTACVAGLREISDAEVFRRNGSGFAGSYLQHDHDVVLDTLSGPVDAERNRHGIVVPVGSDVIPGGPVADGDGLDVTAGSISGGLSGFPVFLNENDVNDAGGALILLNDGVPDTTDGEFDGVGTYDLSLALSVSTGPGGVGNGTVEVSVLSVETSQEENPTNGDLDHPILDETLLYGEVEANTRTGIILFR